MASDLLNTVLDSVLSRIYDHETEIEQRYNELIASGMSDRQAWQQALKEKMEETGWSFLGGALSGGLMAGGRVVTNLSNQSRTGKQARTNGGAKQLYDMAMNMGEDTNSRQLASQIQLTEEGEIQAKDYEIGRLAQALMSETGDQYNKTVRGTVEKDIKEKLNAAGIYRNADEYAKIIADSMTGDGKMSARSKRTLAKDARAIEVWKKYNMPGEYADNLNSRIREATKAETAAQKSVAEAVTGRKIRSYEGGINLASFDDIREAERNGAKRTGGKREVLINGQFAKLDSVRVVKEGDSWKLKLSVNGKDVNASDLQATDYGTAQIIRNAAVMPEFYGERFTNQMLEAQEKGRLKSDNILDDLQEAGMVRLAGYAGIAMPQTTLDRQLAGEIWAESLKEHAENRKAQVAGANRKESGTVSFDGDDYGTEAYNKKVSELDGETRAKLDYVAGIAQRTGVDARFTDLSKTDTTTYGWENKKGIGINIGGLNYGTIEGKSTPTGKHDIVVTFGHELTHWLQRNSLAGYNRLEQYIMNQFAKQRGLKGLRQRLDYFMTQEGLSLEDAMSEVVANGSDQILADEQVAQHIQQTDGKLYTQIKNFVQNLVDRMKKAITGTSMQDSMSRDARVIMANGINDLRKRWMGAWDEALSGVAKETTEQTAEENRQSRSEYSYNNLLRKGDMTVYKAVEISEAEFLTNKALGKNQYASKIIDNIKRENEGSTTIYNKDKGKGIYVNKDSIKHSYGRELRKQYDLVCRNIVPMLQNAIAVNELKGREDNNYATLFFGALETNNSIIVARFNVHNRTSELGEFDILYSTAKTEIKKEGPVYTTPGFTNNSLSSSPSFDLSIADLLDVVKKSKDFAAVFSKDVAKKLDMKRPYDANISGSLKYSKAEMDDLYEQAYNTYDDESGEQLVAEAAEMAMPDSKIRDENGKLKVVYHQTNAVDDEGNPFTVFDMERARHTSDVVGAFFAPEYDQYHEYGERTYPVYLNIKNPAYDVYVDNSITNAGLLKRNELIAQGYDGIINTEDGKPYEYVAFYPEQIKSAEAFTEDDDGDLIPLSERFNDYKDDIRWSRAEAKNNEGALAGSKAIDTGNKEQAVTPSTSEIINDMASLVKLDQEYEDAANRGDIKKTTEMLLEKLADTQGVIPFMAPEWDAGEAGKVSRLLKVADPEAIATAADKMSDYVPDNAVLIPMPGHEGTLNDDSWSVKLAKAISERTGRPVVLALEGVDRESRHEAKKNNEKGISQEEMGFRQVKDLPEGTFPIFVDNEVGTGITADAARQAIGGGITLAYTKSVRSPGIRGLKNVVVTHESKKNGGGLIPLSERFNVSKRDVRYSRAEEALDAGVWMANLTPSAVQTEDERVLMQAYKDKRISISLCLKRQIDYKAKIRELESKESLTGEQRTELENLQEKLEKQQERMAQLEKEMQQITSSEGYAGMMYRYNMVLKDFVQGRTSEQVRDTVEAMLNEVKAAQEQITRRAEELKNLEQTQAVKAMKSFMGKTSLGQQASMLRKQYNSTMNKAEVEDRLAAMALKLAGGQDIQTDAEALAADLVDKIRGIRSENLEGLRGMTLNIGESLRNELKAENSSMNEVRGAIYGSGLVIKAEGNSRLTEQWNELRENNKALPDIEGMAEIDALHTIVDFISGELQASRGSEQYNVNMEEATAICYGAAASVTTYLVKDPAARKQITELMTQIKDLSRKTGSIAEGMDQLNEKMQEVVKAGYKAADWTSILQNDVHTAIDYYNKVARQAAQEEKAQVKKNLIEQLRSENARKLYEQQDKYEELIKNV